MKKVDDTYDVGDSFEFVAKVLEPLQKVRIMAELRTGNLGKRGEADALTNNIYTITKNLEDETVARLMSFVREHPAYSWFSRVKGIGDFAIGRVLAHIDIHKAEHISSLWKFAGYGGPNQNPVKGSKLKFNKKLRTRCYVVAEGLIRAGGPYYKFYLEAKEKIAEKAQANGKVIIKSKKRLEKEDELYVKHLHLMAVRKMIKLFLAHLWIIWRGEGGLPVGEPYSIGILGHTGYIDPWKMVEAEKSQKVKETREERASQHSRETQHTRAGH